MFEFLKKEITEEEKEDILFDAIQGEFELGVNDIAMFRSFQILRDVNEKRRLGLTNNYLLNLLKKYSIGRITAMDEVLRGGRDQIIKNIENKIEELRRSLTEEEQKS